MTSCFHITERVGRIRNDAYVSSRVRLVASRGEVCRSDYILLEAVADAAVVLVYMTQLIGDVMYVSRQCDQNATYYRSQAGRLKSRQIVKWTCGDRRTRSSRDVADNVSIRREHASPRLFHAAGSDVLRRRSVDVLPARRSHSLVVSQRLHVAR